MTSPASAPGARSATRRQVLKATAWATPVIALAATVPAAAASAVAPLRFTNVSPYAEYNYNAPENLLLSIDGNLMLYVDYTAGGPTVTEIQVTLIVPATGMVQALPTVTGGAGWVAYSGTISNGVAQYVFNWTGSIASDPGGPTSQLQFRLPGDGTTPRAALGTVIMTGLATSPNAGPAPTLQQQVSNTP